MEVMNSLAEGLELRGHVTQRRAIYPLPVEESGETAADWIYLSQTKPSGILALLRMLGRFGKWLRIEKPDVVICAMQLSLVVMPVMARLFSPRTRVIVAHHSIATENSALFDRLDSLTGQMDNVAAALCVSPGILRSLGHKPPGYRAKALIIPNALSIPTEAVVDRLAATRAGRTHGRKVVALGRLSHVKNHPVLIRAAAHMPDVTVEIIGGGPDMAGLTALVAQLGVGDRVRLLGQRDREDGLAILANGDVYVQMSFNEGHSIALIEAARLGLPLVVSDVEGQRDGIAAPDGERCGFTVAVEDDRALAEQILALLDDPAALDAAGQQSLRLAQSLDFMVMVDRYEAMIREAVPAIPH
jgi:glycosyltransferase involved in cell wall biosynthesis